MKSWDKELLIVWAIVAVPVVLAIIATIKHILE